MNKKMTYGKWDTPEEREVAFAKVRSGEWDFNRFEEWCRQVDVETWRNATADESF